MEWMPYVHDALEYIEENLLIIENSSDVAGHLNMSEIYLQKGFQVMTGYTVAEYIRNRRLYQAALEVMNTDEKLIDIGLKYGFDSPDSFSRAFSRFHGINPSDMRKTKKGCHKFLPLKVEIQVKGGNNDTSKIIRKYKFKVIGCKKVINTDYENEDLEAFKSQVYDRYDEGKENDDEFSHAMEENSIGEFGIRKYIDEKCFEYMIAGRYVGGDIPEGMCVEEIPEAEWAIIDYSDASEAVMESIENVKKQVSDEKGISDKTVIEWYETPDRDKIGYRSALWFQVAQKKEEKKNGLLKSIIIGSIGILLLIGVSILGIFLHKNFTDKDDTAGKELVIYDESGNSFYSNDKVTCPPTEKVPAMHWLDYNGLRYDSVDIAYGYSTYRSSLVREFSYYVDKIEDYNINPDLIEVGVKIGEYMVYPTDNIPEYSDVLSGETAVLCQVYEITGVDKEFAVAVKRKADTDKYQVFYNPSYKPEELHSFLESIQFDPLHYLYGACFYDAEGNFEKSGEVTKGINAYGKEEKIELNLSIVIDDKEDFSLLLSQNTIPLVDITDGTSTITEVQLGKPIFRITLEYALLAQWYSYIDVYEGGYIATDIGDVKRYFYVGTEATQKFTKKMKTNKTMYFFWKEWNAKKKERYGIK